MASDTQPVKLAYGRGSVTLDVPGGLVLCGPRRPPAAAPGDALAHVASALDAPVGAPTLGQVARGAQRVTLVVPDATRAHPSPTYLLPVLARLAEAGVRPAGIRILIARGLHLAAAPEDLGRLVGDAVLERFRVVQAAPDVPELNVPIGTDDDLGEVRVHRAAAEADLVVLIGVVRPHHLAGFGGGAKALVPGCADRATILAAHRLTLRALVAPDGSLNLVAGRWQSNAFREALERVARSFGRCYLLSLVLDDEQRIVGAVAGEVGKAHERAARLWTALRGAGPPEASDLVLAGVSSPRADDLIQAHKALQAAAAWARPGAPIVWLAEAARGPGSPEFLPWFESGRLERHLAALRRAFHPYGLTAYAYRRLAASHPIHVVSDVSPDVLRGMGLLPAPSPEVALARALEGGGVLRVAALADPGV